MPVKTLFYIPSSQQHPLFCCCCCCCCWFKLTVFSSFATLSAFSSSNFKMEEIKWRAASSILVLSFADVSNLDSPYDLAREKKIGHAIWHRFYHFINPLSWQNWSSSVGFTCCPCPSWIKSLYVMRDESSCNTHTRSGKKKITLFANKITGICPPPHAPGSATLVSISFFHLVTPSNVCGLVTS